MIVITFLVLLIIFLVLLIIFIPLIISFIKKFIFNKKNIFRKSKSNNNNNSDDKSISHQFDKLSKNNKVEDNFKYINEISSGNPDSESILNSLKNKKLEQLFYIKKNIEDTINAGINLEKNIYKLFGVWLAFIMGVYTTLVMGYYSNVKSNLIFHEITNEHKSDNESKEQLNIISDILKSKFDFDNIIINVSLIATLFLIILIVLIYRGEFKYEIDNRIPVLLEQVKLAIEIEKEKYIEGIKLNKNKNEIVITEIIKTTENKARIETMTIKLKNKKVLVKKKLILKKKSSIKKQKVLKDNYKLINPQLYYIEKTL